MSPVEKMEEEGEENVNVVEAPADGDHADGLAAISKRSFRRKRNRDRKRAEERARTAATTESEAAGNERMTDSVGASLTLQELPGGGFQDTESETVEAMEGDLDGAMEPPRKNRSKKINPPKTKQSIAPDRSSYISSTCTSLPRKGV